MCIYLKNIDNLTYKNAEHIFPAGIGGIKTLPKGYVSDQINNKFSKYEGFLMHSSYVSFLRTFNGPGKRGNKNKLRKSNISVCFQNNEYPVLAYMKGDTLFYIVQFRLVNNEIVDIILPEENKENYLNEIGQYLDLFKRSFKDNKIFKICSSFLKNNEILIGYDKDDKRFYLAFNNQDQVCDIKQNIAELNFNKNYSHIQNVNTPEVFYHFRIYEDACMQRVYAKIAINVLAYFTNKDYVSHPNFDAIKEWICSESTEGNNNYLNTPAIHDNFFENFTTLKNIVPSFAHWCFLSEDAGNIIANVCLYDSIKYSFILGKSIGGFSTLNGFICDWKNSKEYSLQDLLSVNNYL